MEKKYCLGTDCPEKKCEICPANKHMLDITDSFRSHHSISPSGYYSSGGLVWIKDPKTGRMQINYSHKAGD